MRHQPGDIRFLHVVGLQRFINDLAERVDGNLKHFAATHAHVGLTVAHLVIALRYPSRHLEQGGVPSIGM